MLFWVICLILPIWYNTLHLLGFLPTSVPMSREHWWKKTQHLLDRNMITVEFVERKTYPLWFTRLELCREGSKKYRRAEYWGSEISLRQIHVRKFNSDNLYLSLIDFNLLILHFNQSHSPPTDGIKTGRFSSRALKVISAILTLDNHMAISQCGHLLLFGSYAKLLFSFEGACNPYEKEEFGYPWTTLIAIFSMQVELACDSR